MTVPKVLFQVAPGATTLTDALTVVAGCRCEITSFMVCNRGGGAATFRIAVAILGAADNAKQYIYYDKAIAANESRDGYVGRLSLGPGDIVRVYASTANLSFSAFGFETR